MNKELLIKYHFETGECETEFAKEAYIEWLEAKVEELSARPIMDCQNCDPLQDAESKIGELRDQLDEAEDEISRLQHQIDLK